jgi:hypothetical protein
MTTSSRLNVVAGTGLALVVCQNGGTMSTETCVSPRWDWPRQVVRALDRPAHHALGLARGPWFHAVAPAVVGLFLVAVSVTVAGLLGPTAHGVTLRADGLRALGEALAVVIPGLSVLATYARVRVTPGELLAAAATGLLVAGVVSVSLVPLLAFLALVSRDVPSVLGAMPLLVSGVALASVAVVVMRVLDAADGTVRAVWLGRCFVAGLFLVFGLRTAGLLRHLLGAL